MSVTSKLSMTVLAALTVAGCGGMGDSLKSDAGWFNKPFASVLTREDGSGNMGAQNFNLGPSGPVSPEELVNADGSCAAAASVPSGDQAGQTASDMPMLGGIGLGMTECQAVRRAGMPNNIAIGAAENNERKVVLTYAAGQWPGIYTFVSGRLKEVDAAPAPERPKPVARKPAPKRTPTRIN